MNPPAVAVRFKCLERPCRRVFERFIMLCNRSERFADTCSERAGDQAQCAQHVFFPSGLHLLLVEDVPSAAVPGAQSQNILASETGQRAFQDGSARGSLADLLCDLGSQRRVSRLTHQMQRPLNTLLRNEAEKGRLFELHGEALAECSVEHWIACPVFEISEDDRIFLRKSGRRVKNAGALMKREVTRE